MNYIIEFSDGHHGILPNDELEYSVSRGRVIIYKDGEKIVDKEITDCPSGKCTITTSDKGEAPLVDVWMPDIKDAGTAPVDGEIKNTTDRVPGEECSEYNVGNMLPQGCGVGGVPVMSRSPLMMSEDDSSDVGDLEEMSTSGKLNADFLKRFIEDCANKIESLKSSNAPGADLKIQNIKARQEDAKRRLLALEPQLVAASDNSVEDGEVVTEVSAVLAGAAVAGGVVAGIAALLDAIKLFEKAGDNIVTASQRPKYKKILDAYYDYFMVDKAPKFINLTKKKAYTNEEGDAKPYVIGLLKKYGLGKESAVVDYSYKDQSVCGCYMEKKYKASFDIFTFIINGGDVVKIDYGWTKHLQTKIFQYKKFENYYIAYMHLSLGFIDNAFKDVVRDVKAEIKKHDKDIKDLKKESVDVDDINLTLTESAIDYINSVDGSIDVTESAKDVILNFVSEVNVSRKIRVLIVEIALLKARLSVATKFNNKAKVAEIKREIVTKEKEKRALLNNQTDAVKSEVKRIEKAAAKEAKKEIKSESVKKESEDVAESFSCRQEGDHVIGIMPDGSEEAFDTKEEYQAEYRKAEQAKDSVKEEKTSEKLLSIKILEDKIEANKKRLSNMYDERQKYASTIAQLEKDNEEYEDSIEKIKAANGIRVQEAIDDISLGDVVEESSDPVVAAGVAAAGVLTTILISSAVEAYQKYKRRKKANEEANALKDYSAKHPDAPKLSDFTRKKFFINADDGKRGKQTDDVLGAAKGIYEYVYYYKGKEAVIVREFSNKCATGTAKDFPKTIKEHEEYVYAIIIMYKHNWITPRAEKFIEAEIKENKELRKRYKGKLVPETAPKKVKLESVMNNYRDIMASFVNEAANIDPAIRDIISTLNAKGYITRYSSAGHFKLRKKEDKEPDGVYKGKLYSDARVQFKGTYHFGAAPKYWFWKKVDGDDYLDVIPITYKDSDGTPDEAFSKWRTNYLNTLERWTDALPQASNKKDDEPTPEDKQVKEESEKISLELENTFDAIFRENGIR